MYNVSAGTILIDGEPIEEKNLNTLREKIGFVPQDLFLFSDTVAKNISFAKEEASIEEIKQYAEYAAVKNDIETLPEKFETLVGERGVTLSGGQKQRISIARAFIKKPNIVILDDCLSAVDSNTEHQILSYLNEAIEDKTAIIITHRISGLINFDKIIALDQGKIIEEGTHEELLGQKGYYFNILEQQNMDDVEN
jgi:ATP-binding cassette subfamily B protein